MMIKDNNFPLSTFHFQLESGFIAFTSLLIISAAALAIAVSISFLGIGEAKSSLDFKKGQEVLKIAESGAEEALLRLRDNARYTDGTLNLGDGSCTINVSGSGSEKTIAISATIPGTPQYVRKLKVIAKRVGNSINLTGWEETE